ncbi:hypothetical protein Tco_0681180 [Tanacetum coccineum]|uniref:Uncharacterized protein n=1 Tax=Tanacetum coccineum TaxID=301880 RepID=A0ABQ4XP64_9ASTR
MTKEKQQALDDALVPKEQRLTIGSCNYRLSTTFKPREPTFQVSLGVLTLTPFYPAFLITKFVDPPFEEEILTFIRELGYLGNIKLLSDVKVDTLPQPWRTFGTIINKCLSGKVTGIDTLHLFRAQILWGLYHQEKVDYVYLLWEDLVFQIENKESRKNKYMFYPRFTKVIINHFMSQDQSIPRRNTVDWHMANDDPIFTTMRFIPQTKYDEVPKPSFGKRVKETTKVTKYGKKKQPALGLETLSDIALNEAEQMKLAIERSKTQLYISQPSGSGAHEGTSVTLGVPDMQMLRDMINEEETHEEVEANVLYQDVNVNLEGRDTVMTDAPLPNVQATQETEDTHVILTTPINPEGQQQSSSMSSGFVCNMLNPRPDTGIDSIFNLNTEATSLIDVSVNTIADPPLVFATTLPPPSTPLITHMQQTPVPTPTIVPSFSLLRDEALAENEAFLNSLDENIKKIIKEQVKQQVKAQVSKIFPRIEKTVNEQLEAELKKILIDKMESNKSIHISDEQKNLYKALVEAYESDKLILDTYGDTFLFKRRRDDEDKDKEPSHPDWFQKPAKIPTPDHDWNKTLPAVHGPVQPWLSNLAQEGPRESFDELMDTPLDFSAFMMNRLKIDTLTPELFAGPTFELMKGTCKSLVELEYLFEDVYKATTDQLDWHNPEGQQYPHDLRKPLPLIPNSCGRQVIPFDHFINNDLVYLSCGVSSRTYATSVTKTEAANYVHIKSIEDLVPNTIWSEVSVNYDKHALWGISHWGRKLQQFYGFAANRESTRDVYSKRRIIVVTKLQIVKWHDYKHLDWITVRRDDDKLYTFKEGDFKRLRLQDIEDMLILLVQGKLTNLNVEDRVESYQKKLNITKTNTYRSDLKCRDAYIAYSNPEGFIYQNKDKKNKLMRIDELHKFSDDTLDDVRTALNDRLKGIRMEYLPKIILTDMKMEILLEPTSKQAHGRSILMDSKVTLTKHGRMTKPYSSPRFIANCFNAGYLKMEVKVPDSS